jgi:hypothetical protein
MKFCPGTAVLIRPASSTAEILYSIDSVELAVRILCGTPIRAATKRG